MMDLVERRTALQAKLQEVLQAEMNVFQLKLKIVGQIELIDEQLAPRPAETAVPENRAARRRKGK